MGGFIFDKSDGRDTFEESRELSNVPSIKSFVYIMKHFPHLITDTTEVSILDRAQSSSLSKAILIAQVVSFCMHCASRLIQRLPLSLLEVSTAAHGFCTLVTYCVWRWKPLNVAVPTILKGDEAREVYALLTCKTSEYYEALEMARRMAAGDSSTKTEDKQNKIILAANALQHLLPNPEKPPVFDYRPPSAMAPGTFQGIRSCDNGRSEDITMTVSCLFYGVVHFLALYGHFPTPLERLLWRVSSVVVACSGLMLALTEFIGRVLIGRAAYILMSTVALAHILSSGFLLGESFRQLFFLDPAAYQLPSWSNYWPRFS